MTPRPRTRANGEGSIFPYRNGYAAYTWVDKPDGKRSRKYVYGQTRETVHEKWIKLQSIASRGPVSTNSPTVAEYTRYWLRQVVEPNLAPLTTATYETTVRLHIVPGLGTKRLDRLQVRDVQTWINQVAKTCQCCAQGKDARRPPDKRRCCSLGKCCHQTVSRQTLGDLVKILRSALSTAVREELVSRNVAAMVRLPAARKRKGQSWTTDQARAFLESARAGGEPFYAAYVLVLVLGLRKGEALGLTWDHVNLDQAELSVGVQLQRVRGQLLHRETKTAGSDSTLPLPLPPICVSALRLRQAEQADAETKAGPAWHHNGLVFATRYGTPIEPRNFSRSYDARITKAAVPRVTVHDARRTCGSLLADLDVHPRVAMQILRHARFATTMEISSDKTRDALKKLGDNLGT